MIQSRTNWEEIYLLRASVLFCLNITPIVVLFAVRIRCYFIIDRDVRKSKLNKSCCTMAKNNQPIGLDIRLNWLTELNKTQKWSRKRSKSRNPHWCPIWLLLFEFNPQKISRHAFKMMAFVLVEQWNKKAVVTSNGCNLIASSLISCDARVSVSIVVMLTLCLFACLPACFYLLQLICNKI